MKKIIGYLFCLIAITGCTTTTNIVNSTPGFVEIKAPRLNGCSQSATDIAQKHCAENGKNAVLIQRWVVPFDGDYCRYECRK